MRTKRYFFQNAIIMVLAFAIIIMSVGYAAYSTQLEIKGTTQVQSSKWSVVFKNPTRYSTSTITNYDISDFIIDSNGTSLSINANMGLNDTFSFVVDVVNDGDYDAKLSSWLLTAKNNDTLEYLTLSNDESSVEDDSITYSIQWLDGSKLTKNETLLSKDTKKLLVTIKTNISSDNELNTSYDYSLTLNYGTIF
jgi:hypothetical protein